MRQTILLILLFLGQALTAQVPQAFNYQGVARDAGGQPLASQPVGVRLTVHSGATNGPVAYQEVHSTITSSIGLFTLAVGQGAVVQGVFSGVQWGASAHFLQVEMDVTGGTNYIDLGTSQLLSVPYALHASGVDCATVSLLGDTLKQSNGCYVIIPGISAANGGCLDLDGDGFYHIVACGPVDCDDSDASVNPDGIELCGNGVDDDCDGTSDNSTNPNDFLDWHPDTDGDGYGDPTITISACAQPAGHVLDDEDCDDNNASVFPGQGCSIVCTQVDLAWLNANQQFYLLQAESEFANCLFSADPEACMLSGLAANSDIPITALCHQCVVDSYMCLLQNCLAQCVSPGVPCDLCIEAAGCNDGFILCTGLPDSDGDGWADGSDCEPNDAASYPDAPEQCDGIDNNCDGQIDEGLITTWYPDLDGDEFGDDSGAVQACDAPGPEYISTGLDCDDLNASVFPGATEICNGVDDNCDGQIDEGFDLTSDPLNCGACGVACPPVPNATIGCAAGACFIVNCSPGFADCDGNPANGCETNLMNSNSNCGLCGVSCPPVANALVGCVNGNCVILACNSGFADCDGNMANGCETNLSTSLSNCGGCGNSCALPNANTACNAGSCVLISCLVGFADCDGLVFNGCETFVGGGSCP